MFKNRTLLDANPGPLTTMKMELFVRLKVAYYSIVTRNSTLNVRKGLRPAFDYNGILQNS